MEVGERTSTALSKLSVDKRRTPLLGMKSFYVDSKNYLVKHVRMDRKLLHDVSLLSEKEWYGIDLGIAAIRRTEVMLPTVSEKEVALITDEWKVHQFGDEEVDTSSQRIDHYWASIFQKKSSQDHLRYPILSKLVKSVLSLAQCSANVVDKRTVTADSASLSDVF